MQQMQKLKLVALIAVFMLLVQVANTLSSGLISSLGIVPRQFGSLANILLAPFVHHSWAHLLSNLVPLMVLTWLALQNGLKAFGMATAIIVLVGGFAVWLFGSAGYHAGASLLVFGYWGLLIALALFRRKLVDIVIAVVVLVLYGSIAWSLLRFSPNISWSSHFFGLLAGILAAKVCARSASKSSKKSE